MELERLSGVQLGALVNKGEIKPTEVIEYFQHRIEARNPGLNAFVYTKFDDAYEEAKKGSDGTTNMLAKFGRIAFKGEESRTILDPGSVFASLMIRTLAETFS